MAPQFSILLVEPSFLLRQKLTCALAREEGVWCVAQVGGLSEMMHGGGGIRPDLILADLSVLKDVGTIELIRNSTGAARIVGLVDSDAAPYGNIARSLGLDGIFDKARVADGVRGMIKELTEISREGDRETI